MARLDFSANADMMSDVKTFTVRDMDRSPSAVLDACDQHGEVEVKRRDGRTYSVRVKKAKNKVTRLPDFRARVRQNFPEPLPADFADELDKLVRGE